MKEGGRRERGREEGTRKGGRQGVQRTFSCLPQGLPNVHSSSTDSRCGAASLDGNYTSKCVLISGQLEAILMFRISNFKLY